MKTEELLIRLKEILADEQINTNEEDLYDASADRYKKYAKARKVVDVPSPKAIVYPSSAVEVSEVMKFCNENRINVIPRSGKTATEGGLENWKEETIVLDAMNLNEIIKIDEYNMQTTVQAGVILEDIEEELRKRGYTVKPILFEWKEIEEEVEKGK